MLKAAVSGNLSKVEGAVAKKAEDKVKAVIEPKTTPKPAAIAPAIATAASV